VRMGASLGAGAIVLANVTIGRFAMVGAGSLVTRDVPDYALSYGSPARRHGSVCRCGSTLHFDGGQAACACGRAFALSGDDDVSES
jgi:UDP-3-O-[3-hydroxymyristoyl] glucosamine N-acyltransferase